MTLRDARFAHAIASVIVTIPLGTGAAQRPQATGALAVALGPRTVLNERALRAPARMLVTSFAAPGAAELREIVD